MIQKFSINIVIRIVFLLLLMAGMLYLIQTGSYGLSVMLGILIIVVTSQLIQYVNQTNRDLSNFFSAVKYDDFTLNNAAARKGKSFEELQGGINLINKKFRDIRAEKEANHQFLQTLIRHVEVGLLCVQDDGEVILMNEALKNILHKSFLVNLESLKKIDERLYDKIVTLEPGHPELIKLNIQNTLLQLSVQAVDMKLQDISFRLYTFQNIQNELEAKELDAWQKLIRILTHEIMNSVAPISSLSSTIKGMLDQSHLSDEDKLEQIHKSIGVIQRRSEGLLDFTETYRTLTRIPPPKFQNLNVMNLLEDVLTLMAPDFKKNNIELIKQIHSDSQFMHGDPHLLEQVLINLLKNAKDAVKNTEDAFIKVSLFPGRFGKVGIQISDNGPGIPADMLDQIFVPFFTTKEEGSGIGLSLSRQIIRMHKGQIEIQSAEGEGTVVTLTI